MKVYLERDDSFKVVKFNGLVKDFLKKQGFEEESVLIVRNSELLTLDDTLSDTDEIKILSVVSGG